MNTDSNTGTLIVRVVGITQGNNNNTQKLPVLMTGVPIRVVSGIDQPVRSTAQPGERHGHTGADGQIAFTDLPGGSYTIVIVAGERTIHKSVDLSPGCDLVHQIELNLEFKLLILRDEGSDYLSLDTVIPYGRNVRLQAT